MRSASYTAASPFSGHDGWRRVTCISVRFFLREGKAGGPERALSLETVLECGPWCDALGEINILHKLFGGIKNGSEDRLKPKYLKFGSRINSKGSHQKCTHFGGGGGRSTAESTASHPRWEDGKF